MRTLDACGQSLNALLIIEAFEAAKKLSPARFLTMRLHSDRWGDINRYAAIPQSIQVGLTPGPLGRHVTRVNCIKPPLGVSDGIVVEIDDKADADKLYFSIHGVLEFIVTNIGIK